MRRIKINITGFLIFLRSLLEKYITKIMSNVIKQSHNWTNNLLLLFYLIN